MPHHTHRPTNHHTGYHTHRQQAAKSQARAETIDTIKDAIGLFAIMTMLFVGLFIPTL